MSEMEFTLVEEQVRTMTMELAIRYALEEMKQVFTNMVVENCETGSSFGAR